MSIQHQYTQLIHIQSKFILHYELANLIIINKIIQIEKTKYDASICSSN